MHRITCPFGKCQCHHWRRKGRLAFVAVEFVLSQMPRRRRVYCTTRTSSGLVSRQILRKTPFGRLTCKTHVRQVIRTRRKMCPESCCFKSFVRRIPVTPSMVGRVPRDGVCAVTAHWRGRKVGKDPASNAATLTYFRPNRLRKE